MSEVSSHEDDWTRAVTGDQGWSDSPSTYAKIKQSLEQSEEMPESPMKPLRTHAAFCREIAALNFATLSSLTKVTLQKSRY